jgi:dimethylhistidine N-methyltransferase
MSAAPTAQAPEGHAPGATLAPTAVAASRAGPLAALAHGAHGAHAAHADHRGPAAATRLAPAPLALAGLLAPAKSLPTWLLYDAAGCAIYEQITTLPEYYLTRAEADVFARHGDALLAAVAGGADGGPTDTLALAELGAGTATKTELLLAAALRRQPRCTYLACDIAAAPLAEVTTRLAGALPAVDLRTYVGPHAAAGPAIAALEGRQLLLFIGSSIGNYTDAEAIDLLATARGALRDDAWLVLGTDLKKSPAVLHAAYDDPAGVTAAFTLNVLRRLNREYGCDFDLAAYRHVAVWNEATANVEIGLQAERAATVHLGALAQTIHLAAGERIHLEISAKYDAARVDRILGPAGFRREATLVDATGAYAVQLARAVRR